MRLVKPARLLYVALAAVSEFGLVGCATHAQRDGELIAPGVRQQLGEEVKEGFVSVRQVTGPSRYIEGDAKKLLVVGQASDADVAELLRLSGEQGRAPDRVTAAPDYAVVQFGDLKRDGCCITEVLFGRREHAWQKIIEITSSH